MKTAFVITTHKQMEQVREGIERIRSYSRLGDSPIYVISTAENDPGFASLTGPLKNVRFFHFKNAPGNLSRSDYVKPVFEFRNWRQEFLPPRILLSIEMGCKNALAHGCDKVVHLHSDSYYKDEDYLRGELEATEDKLLRAEIAPNEYSGSNPPDGRHFKYPLHFHPESLIINLKECVKLRIPYALRFSYIYEGKFVSRHWGGTEALVGQFAMFCLNGKSPLYFEDDLPNYDKLVVRPVREYHGDFPYFYNGRGNQ